MNVETWIFYRNINPRSNEQLVCVHACICLPDDRYTITKKELLESENCELIGELAPENNPCSVLRSSPYVSRLLHSEGDWKNK